MSKHPLPFQVEDISALAKSLKKAAGQAGLPPGHVEWLNILSRTAGYKNFQHFKASHAAEQRLATPAKETGAIDHSLIEQTLRHIGPHDTLLRWPSRNAQRTLWLWSLFSARASLAESEVNELLKSRNSFDDHAILRRALIDMQYVTRTANGSEYRRKEMQPPATARAFIHLMKARQQQTCSLS
ncbi:DUF2087 domain-containing protein [uncultured Cohaesibacter sp.]|uniref:DUF2087 domain-containing protein n=1 Tax=uncultured Cohaesibacter sp. TaxID=1002546 RepID=UPI002AA68BB5|nr:DUF2087 domain-containing protein [uncultured Cohaesibacter sp.]